MSLYDIQHKGEYNDIYDSRDTLLENDQISIEENFFMMGYEDDMEEELEDIEEETEEE